MGFNKNQNFTTKTQKQRNLKQKNAARFVHSFILFMKLKYESCLKLNLK